LQRFLRTGAEHHSKPDNGKIGCMIIYEPCQVRGCLTGWLWHHVFIL
jgi:hypothetical protein